eukprot:5412387-Prymnesium_polylepis.1
MRPAPCRAATICGGCSGAGGADILLAGLCWPACGGVCVHARHVMEPLLHAPSPRAWAPGRRWEDTATIFGVAHAAVR